MKSSTFVSNARSASSHINTCKALAGSLIKKSALSLAVLGALAACQHKSSSGQHVDTASIMADAHMSPSQKSEALALAAEQLISPSGFMYADQIAGVALQLDSKNARARFWKAALGPVIQTRGIANRLAPLMHRLGKDADYQQFITSLRKEEADTQTFAFLMDGPQDIQSEKDVQEYVAQTTLRVDEFRRTMKALSGQDLSIHLNTDLKTAWNSPARVKCTVTQISEGVYDTDCDASQSATVELNAADFKALELSAAGAQVYMTILNGWNLTGAIDESIAEQNQPPVPSEATVQKLLAHPEFGRMRDPATFGVIPDLAKDVISGIRYARAQQAQLCKTGDDSQVNRTGYLFENGFCTQGSDVTDAQLMALDASLSGTPTLLSIQTGGSTSAHLVNLRQLFTHSLRDLRSYLPVKQDTCGDVTSLNNSTFDGTFKAGELNSILAQSAAADCPAQ